LLNSPRVAGFGVILRVVLLYLAVRDGHPLTHPVCSLNEVPSSSLGATYDQKEWIPVRGFRG
jgi:hypothetical protein